MCLRGIFAEGRISTLRLSGRPLALPLRVRPNFAPCYVCQHVRRTSGSAPARAATHDAGARLRAAIANFALAATSQPAHSLRPSFDVLVSCIETLDGQNTTETHLDVQKLEEALIRVAHLGNHADLDILPNAIERIACLSGVSADKYASDIFRRLLADSSVNAALRWLSASADTRDVVYASELSPWRELLYATAKKYDFNQVAQILKHMHELGMPSDPETSEAIFAGLFSAQPSARGYRPPALSGVRFLVKTLGQCKYPYDSATLSTITEGYARVGMEDVAKDAEILYICHLGQRGLISPVRLRNILSSLVERKDRDVVTRLVRRLIPIGLSRSEATLGVLLAQSVSLGDLRHWEGVLGTKATPRVVARMMERRAKGHQSNFELFEYAVTTGISLSAPMLQHVVGPLLTSRGVEKPTERSIDKALEYYRGFVANLGAPTETEQSASEEQEATDSEEPLTITGVQVKNPYPNAATYQLLLRSLTSAKNVTKYLPAAVSLVADMRRFGVQLDWQSATSVIILLMDASPTPEEAFRMYRLIAQPEGKPDKTPILTEDGYVAILDAFCKLPTWPNGVPSVQLYFEIIGDMRKHGIPLGPKAYTVILAQVGRLATATPPDAREAREALAKALARVHNHLNMNPSFTPDTPLWNQLMDAYQRAGCFAEACRIWQTLFASARFNRASVSIILDACAYAQAYDMAVRVYAALTEVEFPMNVRNWNTYLECLCRLGRLDEAMKVLCLEMTGRNDGVEPDKESARILLKFAVGENREGEVRSRLKRFLPKLYYSLDESV